MIIQLLAMAFILAFAIVILGHVSWPVLRRKVQFSWVGVTYRVTATGRP
jgi:hypothetical protein